MSARHESPPGYSTVILEHFRRPRNRRALESATGRGEASNPLCGDHVRFFLRAESGRIAEATFQAEACAICTAAASVLTDLAHGLTRAELVNLADAQLETALRTEIRPARRRCAALPLEAARQAARMMSDTT